MRCPKCGNQGYSRKTMTPEWRCRNGSCDHKWDAIGDDNEIVPHPTLTVYPDLDAAKTLRGLGFQTEPEEGWPIGSGTNRDPYHDRRLSENPNGHLRPVDPETHGGPFKVPFVIATTVFVWVVTTFVGGLFGWSPWGQHWIPGAIGFISAGVISILAARQMR